jgi:hypothetical protein
VGVSGVSGGGSVGVSGGVSIFQIFKNLKKDDLKFMEDDLKNGGRQPGNYDNSQIWAWHLSTDPVLVFPKYVCFTRTVSYII